MVGTTALLVQYFAPLLVFASWLVLTTFLHHHDEAGVPWFADDEWSYVRGNLSSVDRSFGTVLDELTHNIATHQGILCLAVGVCCLVVLIFFCLHHCSSSFVSKVTLITVETPPHAHITLTLIAAESRTTIWSRRPNRSANAIRSSCVARRRPASARSSARRVNTPRNVLSTIVSRQSSSKQNERKTRNAIVGARISALWLHCLFFPICQQKTFKTISI
jgi:hypothetical protein